jgi:hypothetical protein
MPSTKIVMSPVTSSGDAMKLRRQCALPTAASSMNSRTAITATTTASAAISRLPRGCSGRNSGGSPADPAAVPQAGQEPSSPG